MTASRIIQRLCSGRRGLVCLTCDIKFCGLLCLHSCRSLNGMTVRRSVTQTAINRWMRLNLRCLRSLWQFWLLDVVKTTTTRLNGAQWGWMGITAFLLAAQDLGSTKARKLLPRPMFVCTVSLQSSEMQTAAEQEKEAAVAKTLN